MVDGGFDPLHAGHVEYFAEAAKLGVPVLCNLSSDEWVSRKHPVLLPQEQRAQVIDAMRDIAYTHVSSGTTADVLRELRPRYYVKGSDWRDRLPEEEVAVCEEYGTEIVYLDTVRDSSTAIINRYVTAKRRNEMQRLRDARCRRSRTPSSRSSPWRPPTTTTSTSSATGAREATSTTSRRDVRSRPAIRR